MAASPCKGETFIAKSYLITCWRSAGARCVELLRKSFPIHFAPNGASSFSLLVAINISLRWSENDFSQLHLKVESILKVLANSSRLTIDFCLNPRDFAPGGAVDLRVAIAD